MIVNVYDKGRRRYAADVDDEDLEEFLEDQEALGFVCEVTDKEPLSAKISFIRRKSSVNSSLSGAKMKPGGARMKP